jgi:hypothetical protein
MDYKELYQSACRERSLVTAMLKRWCPLRKLHLSCDSAHPNTQPERLNCSLFILVSIVLFFALWIAGCGNQQREEVIGGVIVPVPSAMTKATEQVIELSFPGFEGGKVAYQGNVVPNEILKFYKEEMRARGWELHTSLLAGSGVLAYTNSNRSVLITVRTTDSTTTLAILVGNIGNNASDT